MLANGRVSRKMAPRKRKGRGRINGGRLGIEVNGGLQQTDGREAANAGAFRKTALMSSGVLVSELQVSR
jgi:hypothetical protein